MTGLQLLIELAMNDLTGSLGQVVNFYIQVLLNNPAYQCNRCTMFSFWRLKQQEKPCSAFKLQLSWEGILNLYHSYQFVARVRNRCPESGKELQVSRKAAEEQQKGIPATPVSLEAQLNANAHIMGNK